MHGQNPIRPPEKGDGTILQIQSIFATFQGEGPFAGYPAIFIRLGGCNLACDFCDTEFESFSPIPLTDIIKSANDLSGKSAGRHTHTLAVITGGEPFRQPIAPLCEALVREGYQPQIETNGTLFRDLPESVSIICSPKTTTGKYAPIRDDLMPRITALKFIISASHPLYQTVNDVGQERYKTPVYLQPMDEYDAHKNKENQAKTLALAAQYGYRVCLQMHKILGIE